MTQGGDPWAARLAALTAAVDAAYALRDAPPPSTPGGAPASKEAARDRARKLEVAIDQALASAPERDFASAPPAARAALLLQRGRALDVFPDVRPEAETALEAAVKLDPGSADAWAALAHVFWKKGDLSGAQNCLVAALAGGPHRAALQHLSMLQRRLSKAAAGTPDEVKLVEESVKNAKAAVALDVKDCHSWYLLGNAYLALFFAGGCRPGDLASAMAAYRSAGRAPAPGTAPDLAFNAAAAARYLGDYAAALSGYARAGELDPALPWEAETRALTEGLARLQQLVAPGVAGAAKVPGGGSGAGGGKGSAKAAARRAELAAAAAAAGPPPERYVAGSLASLSAGANKGVAVHCRILEQVRAGGEVPLHYAVVDGAGAAAAVALFGVRHGALHAGAAITLLDPVMSPVDFVWEGARYAFPSLRVDRPQALLSDGKPLSVAQIGLPASLRIQNMA